MYVNYDSWRKFNTAFQRSIYRKSKSNNVIIDDNKKTILISNDEIIK